MNVKADGISLNLSCKCIVPTEVVLMSIGDRTFDKIFIPDGEGEGFSICDANTEVPPSN